MAKSKSKELQGWRESHFGELEKTIQVFIEIRDGKKESDLFCPECHKLIKAYFVAPKERIEAGKAIGRLLSAMSPSKAGAAGITTIEKPTLSKEHSAVLDGILGTSQ